jgi:hypothetical protein
MVADPVESPRVTCSGVGFDGRTASRSVGVIPLVGGVKSGRCRSGIEIRVEPRKELD